MDSGDRLLPVRFSPATGPQSVFPAPKNRGDLIILFKLLAGFIRCDFHLEDALLEFNNRANMQSAKERLQSLGIFEFPPSINPNGRTREILGNCASPDVPLDQLPRNAMVLTISQIPNWEAREYRHMINHLLNERQLKRDFAQLEYSQRINERRNRFAIVRLKSTEATFYLYLQLRQYTNLNAAIRTESFGYLQALLIKRAHMCQRERLSQCENFYRTPFKGESFGKFAQIADWTPPRDTSSNEEPDPNHQLSNEPLENDQIHDVLQCLNLVTDDRKLLGNDDSLFEEKPGKETVLDVDTPEDIVPSILVDTGTQTVIGDSSSEISEGVRPEPAAVADEFYKEAVIVSEISTQTEVDEGTENSCQTDFSDAEMQVKEMEKQMFVSQKSLLVEKELNSKLKQELAEAWVQIADLQQQVKDKNVQ